MATCYSSFDLGPPRHCTPAPHKDYSRPLHVDCSVEYELPNQAKPPEGARSEPLLMIHPCYYRRAESQRRSPFINNLPTPRGVVTASRRSQASQVRLVAQQQQQQQQQQHYQVRYLEAANQQQQQQQQQQQPPPPPPQQPTWTQQHLEPPPVYSKPAGAKPGKRDPLLCGGGDFSSGSDSGVSAGHWTDSDRSPLAPEVRLHRDFHNNNQPAGGGTDSGIATPVSLADDKTVLSELLAATCGGGVEVNNNNSNNNTSSSNSSKDTVVPQRQCHQGTTTTRCQQCHNSSALSKLQQQQPAVGVAAVAPACASCRPGFLHPHTSQPAYQRILQQPWAGMTAATAAAAHYQQPALAAVPSSGSSKHRGGGAVRAVEPGPEHAASSLHHVHVRRSVPWARATSTGAVKRSRTSHTTQEWVYPTDTTWNAQQTTNTKDTVCKACCHPPQTAVAPPAPDPQPQPQQPQHQPQQQQQQPQQQQPQQTQWGSYYGVTGHCRGASEDGSRILWNNENMLRLFQV